LATAVGLGTTALLLLAQAILPLLAASVVRHRLDGATQVTVSVHAMPAIELLWGRADMLRAHIGRYRADAATLAARLREMRGVNDLDVAIGQLTTGRLELSRVVVRKRGHIVEATAILNRDRLDRALLPTGTQILGVTSSGALELETLTGDQRHLLVVPAAGRVVARPEGLLGALFARTVFDDGRLAVTKLDFSNRGDGTLSVAAHAQLG
jgi:hypothetical protein